jgi:hypothetical protein
VKELERALKASANLPAAERKRIFHDKLKQWHPDKSSSVVATQVRFCLSACAGI